MSYPKNQQVISKERKEKINSLLKKLKLDQPKSAENNSTLFIEIFNEALTHTSANAPINHERLEFLGDAVLRLAATEFIEKNFPKMKVGDRSELRSQLVSDRYLTEIGQQINITDVVEIGPKAIGDASAKATIEAEITEAVIGAIYEVFKNIEPVHIWLSPHWLDASKAVLNNPHKHNSKSALQEWSQGKGLNLPQYLIQECSKEHADPHRFYCKVLLEGSQIGEGWGSSRKDAEKQAAFAALKSLQ